MRPGDTWHVTFALSGAATGTPTAKLVHNGAVDPAVGTLSATALSAANTWTVAVPVPPAGYNAGDTIELLATATVSGLTQSDVRGRAYIDAPVTVAPTGLDAIRGFGGLGFARMLRALIAVVIGKRSGVPTSGTGGTITFTESTTGDCGTITVDPNGNITASNLTPPAS